MVAARTPRPSAGGGGGIGAGAAGKTIGGQSGGNAIPHAKYYALTKNGLQIGGAVAGAKFWKDEALNLSLHSLGREFAFAR